MVLVPDRASGGVCVVEDDGDGRLGDARLALLVDEVLEVAGADLREVRDAEDEADGVEDVALAAPVEAGDGVELRVPPLDDRALGVALEPLDDHLLDEHSFGGSEGERSEGEGEVCCARLALFVGGGGGRRACERTHASGVAGRGGRGRTGARGEEEGSGI
jgi:hypothetical protein